MSNQQEVKDRLPADYNRLWLASTLSNAGDGLRIVAVPLLAVTLTRDPVLIAAVSVAPFLPWIVVGPFAGVVVDRVDRKRLMVLVQAVRAVIALAFAAIVTADAANIGLVLMVSLLIGAGETAVDTAAQASVPALVPESLLDRANGRLLASQFALNEVIGASVGAVLFAAMAALPFWIDGATYVIAATLLLTIRRDLSVTAPPDSAEAVSRFRDDLRDGFRHLWDDDVLRPMAVAVAISNVALQTAMATLVLFALDELLLDEAVFGTFMAFTAVGGVLGTLVAGRLVDRLGRGTVMIGGAYLAATGTLLTAVAPNGLVAAATLSTVLFSVSVFNVAAQSLRQTITPPHLLGRIVTASRTLTMSMTPVGAALGGIVAASIGLRAPFLVGAAVQLVAALLMGRRMTNANLDRAVATVRAGT